MDFLAKIRPTAIIFAGMAGGMEYLAHRQDADSQVALLLAGAAAALCIDGSPPVVPADFAEKLIENRRMMEAEVA